MKDRLIFVHGACHGAWYWERNFMPFFQENGYPCVAVDLPGHATPGSTKRINGYSLRDYVKELERVVDAETAAPVLIGHSMGGMVIQKYLEQRRCKKVVLLASVPPTGAFKASLRFVRNFPGVLKYLPMGNLHGAFYQYTRQLLYSPGLATELVDTYREQMCAESFKAFFQLVTLRLRPRLQANLPVLVMGAENDALFTVNEVRQTAAYYGTEALIFPDMAHNLMLDPGHEQVSQAILDWLEQPA